MKINSVLVLGAIMIVILIIMCKNKSSSEHYGTPLGQLAPYVSQMNECINECNREDPSRRFSSPGNFNCGVYCESIFTNLAQHGYPASKLHYSNSMKKCEKQCDDPYATKNEKRKCIGVCTGQNEVAKWCKELWCPYSTFDNDDCMKQCVATNTTNNNQVSWNWLYG